MGMRGLAGALTCCVLLAACGGGASRNHPAPPPVTLPTAATAPVYSDAHACWAFHRATTRGVPASAAGEDTMAWLQGQIGNASPALQAALQRYLTAWQQVNPGKISRSTRAVTRLCRGA